MARADGATDRRRRPPAAEPPAASDAGRDPLRSARAAGLRYVTDGTPGIGRRRSGRGFAYRDPEGDPVRDRETLARIRSLAIPPAWTDVWICPSPNGHIQATGRDARGRKQYRYHPRWRAVRDESKYDRMIAFAEALPAIRERIEADLAGPGLPREKVLAAVVRLLETTFVRVGNDEYARQNRSFGLTTLRDRHARIDGGEIRFRFRGKAGKLHEVGLRDRRLARIVKRCQDLPGQELFQYEDEEGRPQDIDSGDVNDYLRAISGQDFTAKDFRTWAGTVLAYRALGTLQEAGSSAQAKHRLVEAVREVAGHLGNTAAVARRSYIHPAVVEAYLDGSVGEAIAAAAEDESLPAAEASTDEEAALLQLLRERSAAQRAAAGAA
ncbi:MAG TPA: hypothetical protein VF763_06855 [Candidatus Limnocylindrales bacterium]